MAANIASPTHLLLIAVVLVLVFGAKKLPEVGRGIGGAMREFKAGVTGEDTPTLAPAATVDQTSASAPEAVAPGERV